MLFTNVARAIVFVSNLEVPACFQPQLAPDKEIDALPIGHDPETGDPVYFGDGIVIERLLNPVIVEDEPF